MSATLLPGSRGEAAPPAAAPADPVLLESLSIVLPCFNERDNVADAIANATAAAQAGAEGYEIVVVDDGSSDDTAAIVARIAARDRHVRLVAHDANRGYGDAVRTGIAASRSEWVLLTDADLQFDLRELTDLLPLTRSADVLWGWRIVRQDPLARRAAAAGWNRLMRVLYHLPVRDVDCAFKLIRRDVLDAIELHASGALISTELAVKCRAAGANIAEAGVHHMPRVAGEETGGNPRVILRAFRELASTNRSLRRLSHPLH